MSTTTIYDFSNENSLRNWYIVNDGVMGGVSNSKMYVDDEGNGVFYGHVSLDNNGGFASIRYYADRVTASSEQIIKLKVKGDGKKYQFRVKPGARMYYSYIYTFQTSGEWETIEIPLKDMYPSFRGRRLNMPNFNYEQIDEIAILIGNKKEEDFRLMIDYIRVTEE